MYVKEGRKILPDDKYDSEEFNQLCSFKTASEGITLSIILVYRPPGSDNENTAKLCQILKNLPSNSIVIGDFNLPKINWKELTSESRARDEILEQGTVNEAWLALTSKIKKQQI